METYEKRRDCSPNLCDRLESVQGDNPGTRRWYRPSNLAYYAISIGTFGMPQTVRHLRRVGRQMEFHDRMKDTENVNSDIIEFVFTGCLIALQLKAMYEVYSRLF